MSLLYFLGYKIEFFSFQNNPGNVDPSDKMDLDHCNCLGRVKLVLKQNFIGLIQLFVVSSHSREGKTLSYSRINIV